MRYTCSYIAESLEGLAAKVRAFSDSHGLSWDGLLQMIDAAEKDIDSRVMTLRDELDEVSAQEEA